jgi:AraC-like DNA-binding protein
VKYRDQSNVTERIRRILRRHLAEELPSLEDIGQQLAMTPQTLRRRLHDEGQGFRAIKDDLRRDAAIEYLARPELTLPEIAELLGFSEASTFHRAFKHWTGVAPGEYRQTHLRER